MKLLPLYIFYIIIFLVLPIAIIVVVVNSNTINTALNLVSSEANVTGVMMLFLIPFFAGVTTIPKSINDLEKMGYRDTNRAHLVLSIVRRFWGLITLATFALYLIIWIDANGMPLDTYFASNPDLSFVPITMVNSLFSFAFTMIALRNWTGHSDFCLYMARELCKVASSAPNKIDKMTKLISSLRWYGRYIWIMVDLKIADFDNLTAKILSQKNEQQQKTIDSFYQAFTNSDALEPLQVLNTVNEGKEGVGLLVRENLLFQIKKLAVLLSIIISGLTALGSFIGIFILPNIR